MFLKHKQFSSCEIECDISEKIIQYLMRDQKLTLHYMWFHWYDL